MTVVVYKCEACGHEWPRRKPRPPKVCPVCKRTDWSKPRRPRKGTAALKEGDRVTFGFEVGGYPKGTQFVIGKPVLSGAKRKP